jgi:CheY-like chemotaxis protein
VTRQQTILAVDDNKAQNYAICRILERAGFKVITAYTATETIARAREMPDLILLDVNLPDFNGFEVCRRLKADPQVANIPVVFLSAARQDAAATELGTNLGAAAFLFAPVEIEHLLAVVQGTLMRHAAVRPSD